MIKNTDKKANNGFTLAELLIVVAIIGILVAVSIPIFTSKLEAARAETCEANRRSLKAELTTDYMSEVSFEEGLISNDTLRKDYSKNFDFDSFCPKGGVITAEFDGDSFKVYCSEHHSKASLGNNGTINSILAEMKKIGFNLDSGALDLDDSHSRRLAAALKSLGIDLDKLGATSWKYDKANNLFYWTTTDITKSSVGDTVPTIRYNPSSGTYTIWTAKIALGDRQDGSDNKYNVLSGLTPYKPSTTLSKEEQTYETALDMYKNYK